MASPSSQPPPPTTTAIITNEPNPIPLATLTVTTDSNQAPPIEPPLAVPLLLPAPPALTTVTTTTNPSSSSRRLPPPCWTPEETSALIDAYRDKWYALRRGNLRAPHWQEVAEDVHARCPDVTPPKTSIQCRHKMEKLRKRYRAELQRAKSIPHHRFSSSWVYFTKMDSMEKGSSSNSLSTSSPSATTVVAAIAAVNAPPSLPVRSNHDVGYDDNGADDDDDDDDDDDVNGDDYSQRSFPPRRDFNRDPQRDGLRIRIAGNSKRSYGDFDQSPNPNPNYGFKGNYGSNNSHKSGGNASSFATPPRFDDGMRYGSSSNSRFFKNGGSMNMSNSSGLNNNNNSVMMMMKKRKVNNGLGKRERESKRDKGDEAAMEMVDAIRMLGEGFVRMENMKMEMLRDSERMRMEMELKRTEMLLESQNRIVEAFAQGWSDVLKNNKDDS